MPRNYLITGGAGFIGSNYVARLLQRGEQVTVFDNLSRAGAIRNLNWLKNIYGENSFRLVRADVRDFQSIQEAAAQADVIVHLAGQVAVTTSVVDPRNDFEVNALGTFNVLEAARLSGRDPIVIYASTNKVYGGMEEVRVKELESRYAYVDYPLGIPETFGLDFHSPYGCSKGCGDQYTRDYARIYGLRTVVMRQSCIYGTRQFGIEDQGWVAWFVIAAVKRLPITIYGDGKQVRDVLFVEDLCDVYDLAIEHIDLAAGQVFNIGGGAELTISVWEEFGQLLEKLLGENIPIKRGDWRPGDQRVFISDIRKAQKLLGWKPKVGVEEGIQRLFEWVKTNQDLF
ncbi:MAG: CDP-paratose 2-epimerase [Bellilinea sp.]|nr:MAG: CDP-paratose 2-epimerase [Bellilinea sp.]